ncbi:Meiotically up-regulated gene 65 protein [Trametes pubescens]|uniref:Meiotically up-regulated gene 65 protein n=1 Tax=Trametes pubescens TaxID=154538 RepID=A0A1M2W7M4_TRAPU|nr:Meiotically up-regulated gene 65 protein [Trametes pubescens]
MSEPPSLTSSPAGPSSSPLLREPQPPPQPPPNTVLRDDYNAVDAARQRFQKRSFFSSGVSLPDFHRRKSRARKRDASPTPSSIARIECAASASDVPELVDISDASNLAAEIDEDYDKDVYRWAVLYENQRGAMVFSTAYYSALTLLPLDPPPFTIPTAIRSPRKGQPTVSLEDYPLPDGLWKWVSRAWMIDMRGDGQVQYDGFEYSRSFRSKKWGSDPGVMSNRGLVRRRRWIRLMMRPAQSMHDDTKSTLSIPGVLSVLPQLIHNEDGATRPPSVMLSISDDGDGGLGVWNGDEGDWDRCHAALRRLGRDGRKLELWASWLGIEEGAPLSRKTSRNPSLPSPRARGEPLVAEEEEEEATTTSDQTEADRLVADARASLSEASKEHIAAVVRIHGSDILEAFVYPDSRAQFLQYLRRVGLLAEFRAGLGTSESARAVDFWSYTQDLDTTSTP